MTLWQYVLIWYIYWAIIFLFWL